MHFPSVLMSETYQVIISHITFKVILCEYDNDNFQFKQFNSRYVFKFLKMAHQIKVNIIFSVLLFVVFFSLSLSPFNILCFKTMCVWI